MFITLQLDMTIIGRLIRENAELTKKVQFKDGQHQLLNIAVGDRREPDKYGNNLTVSCKPKDAPKDNKWYIGQGKTWEERSSTPTPSPQPSIDAPTDIPESNELPF